MCVRAFSVNRSLTLLSKSASVFAQRADPAAKLNRTEPKVTATPRTNSHGRTGWKRLEFKFEPADLLDHYAHFSFKLARNSVSMASCF